MGGGVYHAKRYGGGRGFRFHRSTINNNIANKTAFDNTIRIEVS